MKKGFQWMALLVVAMLGACSGGSDKAAEIGRAHV